MSAPKAPPDNSLAIRQMEIAQENRRRAEEAAREEQRRQQLAELRTNAGVTGRTSAQDYFRGQGVDPSQYGTQIDSLINSTLAGIGPEDPNPGSYFSNIGETAFNRAQDTARAGYGRTLDQLFAPNFETQRIPWTLDDPYLSAIEAESRATADDYIRNMLERGVITDRGYEAARSDLERQAPGVRSRLNEIGTTTLAEGQGILRDIANQARQGASTYTLGSVFDPYSFQSQADTAFDEFVRTLGDTLRGKAPQNLFSTAGLANIAGSAQGAQNLRFDPGAISGSRGGTDEEEEDKTPESVF